MITLTQEFEVRTSRQALWDFLLDVDRVAACMPGVEHVERVDDETYQARMNVKVGPIKAALEAAVRYAAAELGPKGISVHALSPGPLKTRAASGIAEFDELLDSAASRAPTHHLASIDDVGAYAAFLASEEAFNVTGGIHPIDGGYTIVG